MSTCLMLEFLCSLWTMCFSCGIANQESKGQKCNLARWTWMVQACVSWLQERMAIRFTEVAYKRKFTLWVYWFIAFHIRQEHGIPPGEKSSASSAKFLGCNQAWGYSGPCLLFNCFYCWEPRPPSRARVTFAHLGSTIIDLLHGFTFWKKLVCVRFVASCLAAEGNTSSCPCEANSCKGYAHWWEVSGLIW